MDILWISTSQQPQGLSCCALLCLAPPRSATGGRTSRRKGRGRRRRRRRRRGWRRAAAFALPGSGAGLRVGAGEGQKSAEFDRFQLSSYKWVGNPFLYAEWVRDDRSHPTTKITKWWSLLLSRSAEGCASGCGLLDWVGTRAERRRRP